MTSGLATRLGTLALLLAISTISARAQTEPAATGAPSLAALRQGGYVIFFRHALEDGIDQTPVDLNDCATQQFLTDQGQAQARSIGQEFRSLGIPVGEFANSFYCRARDTALLAFGANEPREILTLPAALDSELAEQQPEAIRRLLATSPRVGTNTVYVSHSGVLMPATGIPIERAEAAVFRPDGRGGYTFLAILTWDQWADLASGK